MQRTSIISGAAIAAVATTFGLGPAFGEDWVNSRNNPNQNFTCRIDGAISAQKKKGITYVILTENSGLRLKGIEGISDKERNAIAFTDAFKQGNQTMDPATREQRLKAYVQSLLPTVEAKLGDFDETANTCASMIQAASARTSTQIKWGEYDLVKDAESLFDTQIHDLDNKRLPLMPSVHRREALTIP